MTPTEAGVREYCANTREMGNLALFLEEEFKSTGAVLGKTLRNYLSKSYITCYQIH
ncbi:uncharacterized protein EbC_40440 [Erwinia billingiae Eb661]|uniref:Uncharacterized protein n=1 Tax=Erwinia billingiae (strain Eb661) TaxID=634500 RepID=D8MXL8_ERWBE|nr:uncharacterized protein EbC_40440 [Erwinia billingiae Eb661]